MDEVSSSLPPISWLKKILGMRWNLIYTSAIDGIAYKNCSATPIVGKNQPFKVEFAKKQPLHIVEIFGNVSEDNRPAPVTNTDLIKISYDCLYYINNVVEPYGILIIDGWRADDWLKGNDLFNIIKTRNYPGTYFFGISETELLDNISSDKNDSTRVYVKELIESKFIFVEEVSFAQKLQSIGFFERHDREDESDASNLYSITFFPMSKRKYPIPFGFAKMISRVFPIMLRLFKMIWLDITVFKMMKSRAILLIF